MMLREIIDAYEARQAARLAAALSDSGGGPLVTSEDSTCLDGGEAENLVLSTGGSSPATTAFGSILMRYRAASGLSRPQLARVVDVDPSYVWLMERGRRLPSLALTLRLADVLMLGSMQRAKLLAGAGFVGSARRAS